MNKRLDEDLARGLSELEAGLGEDAEVVRREVQARLMSRMPDDKKLIDEIVQLRAGLKSIVDAHMSFDNFDGAEAHAIASKLLAESRERLPEVAG